MHFVPVKNKPSAKLLGLIASLLIFETIFWLAINNLNATAQKDVAEASKSIALVNKIDSISRRAVDIVSTCADPTQADEAVIQNNIAKLDSEFAEAAKLTESDSEKRAVIATAKDTAMQHITARLLPYQNWQA